jgi:hypothetical protein
VGADRSAADGDYAEALEWLAVVESVDGQLPDEFETKRETWLRALTATPAGNTAS